MSKEIDMIPIIKPSRAKRRKRCSLAPAHIRQVVEILHTGCNTSVKYNADPLDMANHAVANMRDAIYQAINILESEKRK